MYLQICRIRIDICETTIVIVVCIYRHPHMDFNDYYISNLLDKLSKENKTVSLLGGFNIDVLNYDQHSLDIN